MDDKNLEKIIKVFEDALITYKEEFEKQPHSKLHFDLILKTEEKIKNLKKKL